LGAAGTPDVAGLQPLLANRPVGADPDHRAHFALALLHDACAIAWQAVRSDAATRHRTTFALCCIKSYWWKLKSSI